MELTAKLKVAAIPKFIYLKDGEIIDCVEGINCHDIEDPIIQMNNLENAV